MNYYFLVNELFQKSFLGTVLSRAHPLYVQASAEVSHRVISHTTFCFSNLVGPVEEIGYYGHPMAYLAPSSFNQPHVRFFVRVFADNFM